MKNKMFLIIVLLVSFLIVKSNVFAATYQECDDGSCSFKSLYEKSFSVNVTSSNDDVTVYARSICENGNCKYTYQGQYSDVADVLSRGVKCTNGEKYINYILSSSGGGSFKGTSEHSGTVYWSEDYKIVCTNDSSSTASQGEKIELKDSGTSGSTSSGNTGSGNNEYQSSGTVNNEELGVNTYFIVLALVSIISYGFMLVVKKYNLFKKI